MILIKIQNRNTDSIFTLTLIKGVTASEIEIFCG